MDKLISCIKQHKAVAIIIVVALGYLWYAMPFKATDPSSPFFSESLFRMRDYASNEGIHELQTKVFPKLFPVGTPKSYVDKILSHYGGADIVDDTNDAFGAYTYVYKSLGMMLTPDSIFVTVYYDKNARVEAIWFGKMVVGPTNYKPVPVPHIPHQPNAYHSLK